MSPFPAELRGILCIFRLNRYLKLSMNQFTSVCHEVIQTRLRQ